MRKFLTLLLIISIIISCQEKSEEQVFTYDFSVEELWEAYHFNDFNLKGNVKLIIQKEYVNNADNYKYLDSIFFNEENKILIEKSLVRRNDHDFLYAENRFVYNDQGDIIEAKYIDYERQEELTDHYEYDGMTVKVSRKEEGHGDFVPFIIYEFKNDGRIDHIQFLEPHAEKDVETYYYNEDFITFNNRTNLFKGNYFFFDDAQTKLRKFEHWNGSRDRTVYSYTYDTQGNIKTIIRNNGDLPPEIDTTTYQYDYDDRYNWIKKRWDNNPNEIYLMRTLHYNNE